MASSLKVTRFVTSRLAASSKHGEVPDAEKKDLVSIKANISVSKLADSPTTQSLARLTNALKEHMQKVYISSKSLIQSSVSYPTQSVPSRQSNGIIPVSKSLEEAMAECNDSIKQYYGLASNSETVLPISKTVRRNVDATAATIASKKAEISMARKMRVSRVEVNGRMKSLVINLTASGISHVSRLHRLKLVIDHIKAHPDTRQIAVQHGVIPFLLSIRTMKYRDETLGEVKVLKGLVKEALAALGHVDALTSKGIRILSIDGGGTRGLVAIETLKQLELLCQKPVHQLFDYICGVSTGALLAVLVGAMKLPLDKCEEVYKECSKRMFSRSTLAGAANLITKHSFFDTSIWETILKEEIGIERSLLSSCRDPDTPRLGLLSTVMGKELAYNYVFRNYNHDCSVISQYPGSCSANLWEAIRASSAAPGYFEEFKLGNTVHQDGGVLKNNPTAVAIHESKLIWPNQPIQCVVSLGNGRYEPAAENDAQNLTSLKTKLDALIRSATNTEDVHTVLHDLLDPVAYYRFNPYLSQEFMLSEIQEDKLYLMQFETNLYLRRNASKLHKASKQLLVSKSMTAQSLDRLKANLAIPFHKV